MKRGGIRLIMAAAFLGLPGCTAELLSSLVPGGLGLSPAPGPAQSSFGGRWYSCDSFVDISVDQHGNLAGTVTHTGPGQGGGQIAGTANGNHAWVNYLPNATGNGPDQEQPQHVELTLSPDGSMLSGTATDSGGGGRSSNITLTRKPGPSGCTASPAPGGTTPGPFPSPQSPSPTLLPSASPLPSSSVAPLPSPSPSYDQLGYSKWYFCNNGATAMAEIKVTNTVLVGDVYSPTQFVGTVSGTAVPSAIFPDQTQITMTFQPAAGVSGQTWSAATISGVQSGTTMSGTISSGPGASARLFVMTTDPGISCTAPSASPAP